MTPTPLAVQFGAALTFGTVGALIKSCCASAAGEISDDKIEFASKCVLPTSWTNCKAPGVEHELKGGGDAIRPYTPISPESMDGRFQLLVKRYREWGTKPTDNEGYALHNSYRPPGAVSNYLHDLEVGENVQFCHLRKNLKISYPFEGVKSITMIAVGAGIAPMIQALQKVLESPGEDTRVVLLYGNRFSKDILLKEVLDEWSVRFGHRFKVVYAVGSRWQNVHVGINESAGRPGRTLTELSTPPDPEGFEALLTGGNQGREVGWVDQDAIAKHAFPPAHDTRVFVCGLPGVYDKLCGPRLERDVPADCALARLGYGVEHVVKL